MIEKPEEHDLFDQAIHGQRPADVRDDLSLLPFEVSAASDSIVRLKVFGREYTPPQISAFILRELKRNAEAALGEEIINAVITVPAYFNDAQRQATKDAGRIAGLDVLRIVNEPTAASLAYGLQERRHGIIAVYDFGGGTFDISILKLSEGIFEVLSTNGDTHLGGDDIDDLLIRLVLADLKLPEKTPELPSIRQAAKKSEGGSVFGGEHGNRVSPGWDIRRKLTRAEFDTLIEPIVERTLKSCRQALQDAGLQPDAVDEVVMVGGSTRIPLSPQPRSGTLRTGASHEPQSRRSGRSGRRSPGRHSRRRKARHAAARRHSSFARHRNDGRRHVEDHSAKLDHSCKRERKVHDVCRWTDEREGPRASGRTRTRSGLPEPRAVRSQGYSADAGRPAADRREVPYRRRRHPERFGTGAADRQVSVCRREADLRPYGR